jgi:hypothetical protein
MQHVSTKFIPQILMAEHKDNWLNNCTDLLQQAETDENIMKLTTTSDETGVQCWNKARIFK